MAYKTLLYYKYILIPEAETFAAEHLETCKRLGLTGRIIIGDEGINGTVSGTESQCTAYMHLLEKNSLFSGIEFKIDDTDEPSFNRMHVRYKPEIVVFGGRNRLNPNEKTGERLEPDAFMKMKDDEDVLILDTRNTVEHTIGKFKNAHTLDIDHFRDFPEKVKELEPYKHKKILAYCTGGIRCEKATAYLIEQGFEHVYQLHGGIIQYGKETGGVDFDGRCYVFDKRLSVEVNTVNPKTISVCKNCNSESVRMVNCANAECNEHFIQCESCGEKFEGCCSEPCMESSSKRTYNGTGYYVRPIV